jgi:hypothetical protein
VSQTIPRVTRPLRSAQRNDQARLCPHGRVFLSTDPVTADRDELDTGRTRIRGKPAGGRRAASTPRELRHPGRLPEPARTPPLTGYSPESASSGRRAGSLSSPRLRAFRSSNLLRLLAFRQWGWQPVSDFNPAGVRLHNGRRSSTAWTDLRVHGHPATAGPAPARGRRGRDGHPPVAAPRGRCAGLLRLCGRPGRCAAADHVRSLSLPAARRSASRRRTAALLISRDASAISGNDLAAGAGWMAYASSSPPAGGPQVTGGRPNSD